MEKTDYSDYPRKHTRLVSSSDCDCCDMAKTKFCKEYCVNALIERPKIKEPMKIRTCFECIYQKRCHTFKEVHDATQYGMNIDSNDTPGTIREIFIAVANACLDYKKE